MVVHDISQKNSQISSLNWYHCHMIHHYRKIINIITENLSQHCMIFWFRGSFVCTLSTRNIHSKTKHWLSKKLKNIITYKIDWKYMYVRFVSESRSYIWYDSWGFLKISQKKEKNQEILRIFSGFSLTNFQIKTLHHILGHRKKTDIKKYQNYFNVDKSWKS